MRIIWDEKKTAII